MGAPQPGQADLPDVPTDDEISRKQYLEELAREIQQNKELEEEYRTEQSQRPTSIWAPVPSREPEAPHLSLGLDFITMHRWNEDRLIVVSNEQTLFLLVSLGPRPRGEVRDRLTSADIMAGLAFVACANGATRPLESHVFERASLRPWKDDDYELDLSDPRTTIDLRTGDVELRVEVDLHEIIDQVSRLDIVCTGRFRVNGEFADLRAVLPLDVVPATSSETTSEGLRNLGCGKAELGKLDEALADLYAAARLTPDDLDLRICLFEVNEQAGRLSDAMEDARKLRELVQSGAQGKVNTDGAHILKWVEGEILRMQGGSPDPPGGHH